MNAHVSKQSGYPKQSSSAFLSLELRVNVIKRRRNAEAAILASIAAPYSILFILMLRILNVSRRRVRHLIIGQILSTQSTNGRGLKA